MALAVPLSRFAPRVGGGSAFYVRPLMNSWRIVISSICAMVLVSALFAWLVLWYDDIMPQDKDYPPSFLEQAFSWVCVLAMWPAWITEMILGHDPVGPIYGLLLWTATGLFWGLAAELFFVWRARKRPNKSPEPTAVGAGSSAIAVQVPRRRWLSFFR